MTKKALSKKLLSCMLILAVGASLMAGCKKAEDTTAKKEPATSGTPAYLNTQEFPIVKEPIKLKVMGSRSPAQGPWEEMDVIKKMESMTGISFTFDTPPQASFTEKKNLTFASGSSDLPDVFLGAGITINEEETYGPQGLLIPLEGLIDKYAPHIKKLLADRPDVKKAITATDGHIYSLPYIVNTKTVASNILYMDMKWLQNVGMQKPTNVDELYNVLKAFKEKDPNQNGKPDEIPISAVKTPVLQGTLLTAFTGTGGMARDGFNLKDGKVVYEPAMPEYKEYLAYLKKLYAEGLLDKETFTQTSQQMSAKGKAGSVGVVTASLSSMVDPKNYNPYELLPPLTSKTNSKKVTALLPGITTGAMAITKNCKYPEAMLRWADVFYRDDDQAVQGLSGMSMFLGIRGEHWDYSDSAKTKYTRVQKDKSISAVENTTKTYTPGGSSAALPSKVITNAIPDGDPLLLLKATESDKHYFPYNVQTYPSTVRFTKNETERITFLTADIKNYVTQMEAKFIVGEESLDKWDNYIATLKKMNLDELTKIYTDGFERWNKTK
jgi:putative aldouronate transport system substrate-binding protein